MDTWGHDPDRLDEFVAVFEEETAARPTPEQLVAALHARGVDL